jgi:nitrate/nitrite transporter NarK
MDAGLLASIAGVVLSLLFSHVPGLDTWYAKLDGKVKRLIMAGLLLVVAGASFGLACADLWLQISCTREGAIGLVEAFVMALIANQATYQITPRNKRVEMAIAESIFQKYEGVG